MRVPKPLPLRWLGLVALGVACHPVGAQELELRTYSNAPSGVHVFAVGYGYSTGNVLLDPALPIEDATAVMHVALLRYVTTFGLFGKTAKLKVLLPLADGTWEGTVDGQPRERQTSGLADLRLTLDFNFVGAPALSPQEFAKYRQKTVFGGSLSVAAPTGGYDEERLINLGSNRWAARGEVGVSQAVGRSWFVEGAFEAWYYADNDEFLVSSTLAQEPFYALKVAGIRTIKPGCFVGIAVGRGQGGATEVNGAQSNTEQGNWRFSLSGAYPIDRRNGVSAVIMSGRNDGAGSEFDQFAVVYQYAWGF